MDLFGYPYPTLPGGAGARLSGRPFAVRSPPDRGGGHEALTSFGGSMMAKSPLFGRRIHIAGSVSDDPAIASTADVETAREFVRSLVQELVCRGATFVLPVDAEK